MLRALIWKEWREQRSVILAGIGIAAVLPLFLMAGIAVGAPNRGVGDLARILPGAFVLFVWPLMATAAGATTIAADQADGGLRFLLSRPVTRSRVWLVKVALAVFAFVCVALATVVLALLYQQLALPRSDSLMWIGDDRVALDEIEQALPLFIALFFLFACSVYCSGFFKRTLTAAAAGFAVALAMLGVIGSVWIVFSPRLGSFPSFNVFGAAVSLLIAGLGVLVAAFWTFVRGETPATGARHRIYLPLAAVASLSMLIAAVPASFGAMRWTASMASQLSGHAAAAGDRLVLPELSALGLTTRVVMLDVDGSDRRTLVEKNGSAPSISPDGRWVTYLDYGGLFGALTGRLDLRAMRTDGSEDHLVATDVPWPWWWWRGRDRNVLFAPDGDRVAYNEEEGRLVVASLGSRTQTSFDLDVDGLLGWTDAEPAELLFYEFDVWGRGYEMRRTMLRALDSYTGTTRTIWEVEGRPLLWLSGYYTWGNGLALSSQAWRWLPAWILQADGQTHLDLIDTASGEQLTLSNSPCRYFASAGDDRVLYGNCSGELRYGDSRVELRWRDLESGEDELFAVLEGYEVQTSTSRIQVSPDRERVLLYAREGYRASELVLISADGQIRHLAAGWWPISWIDDGRALVGRRVRGFQLGIVDIETGRIRSIHP